MIKEFLKPDWRKIVVFFIPIILTIIALFLNFPGSGALVIIPALLCGIIPGCITDIGRGLYRTNNALNL